MRWYNLECGLDLHYAYTSVYRLHLYIARKFPIGYFLVLCDCKNVYLVGISLKFLCSLLVTYIGTTYLTR